jgi:hypothetical protein
MDFSKLSNGAKLALVGGVVLVVNLFLPWYGISGILTLNAFDSVPGFSPGFLAWGGSLIAIAGAVVLLLKAFGTKTVNAGQFKTEQLAVLLGGIGFVLIFLRWITETDAVKFGVFLGIAASAVVTYGAWMAMKDAGLQMPGMSGGGSGSGGGDSGM